MLLASCESQSPAVDEREAAASQSEHLLSWTRNNAIHVDSNIQTLIAPLRMKPGGGRCHPSKVLPINSVIC